jgi:DNA-binding MarR family transcriptional regulator
MPDDAPTGTPSPSLRSPRPLPVSRRAHAEQLAGDLGGLVKRMERAGHQSSDGVDRAAYALLAVLVTRGPLRAKVLAETVRSDPSTVSRQIATLVRVGYIARRADQTDGRAAVLDATTLGRQVFTDLRARRTDKLAALTAHWPADDLARLVELVHRLVDDLDHAISDTSGSASPGADHPAITHPGSIPGGSITKDSTS